MGRGRSIPAIFEKRSAADREMYWVQKSRCKALRYGDWKIVIIQKTTEESKRLATLQHEIRPKRTGKYRFQTS